MGWAILAVLAASAFALLLRLRVSRGLTSFIGAALMLGAAGYALQGRPDLAGVSASPAPMAAAVDPELSVLRSAMFGRYSVSDSYFAAGDALTRSGNPHSAVGLYLGAVGAQSANAALWTGLGEAYARHDDMVSPAARFAFDRAMKLAPEHPGPPFFLGLALVRSGEFRDARIWWRRAYRLTPAGAQYRAAIGDRLRLLETYLASDAGRSSR